MGFKENMLAKNAAEALKAKVTGSTDPGSDLLETTVADLLGGIDTDQQDAGIFIDDEAGVWVACGMIRKPLLSGNSIIIGGINGNTPAKYQGRPVRASCNLFAKATAADKAALTAAGRVKAERGDDSSKAEPSNLPTLRI